MDKALNIFYWTAAVLHIFAAITCICEGITVFWIIVATLWMLDAGLSNYIANSHRQYQLEVSDDK